MKRFIVALALALTPALPAFAENNAEVVSVPADDAVLATAPSNVALTFEHAVVLTQVQLHGPGETNIPINFTAGTAAQTAYTVALPALTSGTYEVHWNATGDGHAMEGELHFTVQ